MKTKNLLKDFCQSKLGLIISLVLYSLLSAFFTVSCPIAIGEGITSAQKMLTEKEKYIIGVSDQLETYKTSFEKAKTAFLIWMGIAALCIIFVLAFNSLRIGHTSKFGNDLNKDLKTRLYSIVINGDINNIEKFDKEDIKGRIIEGSEKIGNEYFGGHIIPLSYYLILSIAFLILTFIYASVAGLVCLVCIPILYVSIGAIERLRRKKINEYKKNLEKEDAMLTYSLDNVKNIKIRNGLVKEEENYKDLVKKLHKNYSSVHTVNNLSKSVAFSILLDVALITIAGLICYTFVKLEVDVVGEEIYLGKYFGMVASTVLFLSNLKDFLILYLDKQNIDKTYETIDEILELKQESRKENIDSIKDISLLRFNNVSFEVKCDNNQDNKDSNLDNNLDKNLDSNLDKIYELKDIDFEVKKGERLGILGLENCGKSIIADLTSKIIRPTSGFITINSYDINKINTHYLRDIVTYIPKNFNLIDDTLEANIIYPYALDEYKYNDALNKCSLKELLFNLEDRDQTMLSSVDLSDADKQRIILANAIYKDSPIIVLDDATSNLDPISEERVMNEIFKLKNKIILCATSHINVAVKCDKVLLMSNGQILEYGKTEELLMNNKSVLSRMVNNTTDNSVDNINDAKPRKNFKKKNAI